MKKYSEVKKAPFDKLEGISEKASGIHHDKLYVGYVNKWQEIQDKLQKVDKSTANATFSELRELKLEESFAANGILLHESYFDVLGGNGTMKNEEILEAIKQNFGSFEAWLEEFKALGLCARGWVVLAYDFNDGKLHNYLADWHSQGGIWGVAPLLVLDVYEHAYFMDYGSDRKSYIEDFFKNLNWQEANNKFLKIAKKNA